MRKLSKYKAISDGFTLIELMIVIVVIGILSGILIAIINPAKTQARAKDATTKAAINKVALAASAFVSSTGIVPTGTELGQELAPNVVPGTVAAGSLLFTISGIPLPTGLCANDFWKPGTGSDCSYYYCGGVTGGHGVGSSLPTDCTAGATDTYYKIMAKSWVKTDGVFVYDSYDSRLYMCTTTAASCVLAN